MVFFRPKGVHLVLMKKHTSPPIKSVVVRENFNHGLDLNWREHSQAFAIIEAIRRKKEREAQARRAMLVLPGVSLPQRK